MAAAEHGAFADSLHMYSSQGAAVEALGLHNTARCKDAYVRPPVRSAPARRVASENRLQSGRFSMHKGATFVLYLGENSDAEEELGLAELDAPAACECQ